MVTACHRCFFCASGFALSQRRFACGLLGKCIGCGGDVCAVTHGATVNFGIQSLGFANIWLGIFQHFWVAVLFQQANANEPMRVAMSDSTDSLWSASQIDPPIRVLTRDEAQALLARHPPFSLWQMLQLQSVMGLVVSGLWWIFSGQAAGLSSLYGVAVVLVPNALMVRALSGALRGSVAGLVVWEFVKVVVAGCMLVLAPFVFPAVVWPALLVAAVLCMKVLMVASLWRGRGTK
jgi:ATP synthase protein I